MTAETAHEVLAVSLPDREVLRRAHRHHTQTIVAQQWGPAVVGTAGSGSAASATRAGRSSTTAPTHAAAIPRTSRTFILSSGRAQRRFTMREPAGVMLLTRITVPHGVHAYVDAEIGKVGGTRFSTAARRPDPALSCRRDGGYDVCTQQQEWCPMPSGRWQLHLVKLDGQAGQVRVDFVFGPPPPNA